MTVSPRVVVCHRQTEYDALLAHHGTRGQAAFFLSGRGRDLAEVEARHDAVRRGLDAVAAAIPLEWRRGSVEREDLARYLFTPDDIVVVVGQDGLVPNVAKYLDGQPVIGVNPDPAANAGLLCQAAPEQVADLLAAVVAGRASVEERTMVRLAVDDGQELLALNEIYVGQANHQSSRYTVRIGGPDGVAERQSSSGVLIGTGTGATGWCSSAARERHCDFALPTPADGRLAWFVREAWPSPNTGTAYTAGLLESSGELVLDVESDSLVAFGDGVEVDHLTLAWGQRVTVSVARRTLRLVGPPAP
ncbi:NAD(+)/NADH kinase [Nocardioides speluncae]|uniref:NAD(+)/NADH kinase n=1 Tax=Nocardioides speluncae TaxID=2670337 RepID=UPI000D69B154|nr:NAD(+)/NADH kinase [Nocardioides speluncae]